MTATVTVAHLRAVCAGVRVSAAGRLVGGCVTICTREAAAMNRLLTAERSVPAPAVGEGQQ